MHSRGREDERVAARETWATTRPPRIYSSTLHHRTHMKRGEQFALPPSAVNGHAKSDEKGANAGVMLSPSKRCKLSPDSVVMITPATTKGAADKDGLAGDDVRASREPARFFLGANSRLSHSPHATRAFSRLFILSPRSSSREPATRTRTTSSSPGTLRSRRTTSTSAPSRRSGSPSTRPLSRLLWTR